VIRILLVEDELPLAERLERIGRDAGVDVVVATHHDAAMTELDTHHFDLAICDLRIPEASSVGPPDNDHGKRLCLWIRSARPGLPLIVLTAYGATSLDFLGPVLEGGPQEDFLGSGQSRPMVRYFAKDDLDLFTDELQELIAGFTALDRIELATGGRSVELQESERRLLRVFARRQDGVVLNLEPLGRGRSESTVIRSRVVTSTGATASLTVAKLGPLEAVQNEKQNYDRFVAPILPVGSFANFVELVTAGGGDTGALFHRLADDCAKPLFDVIETSPDSGEAIVADLQAQLRPWYSTPQMTEVSLGSVRANLVDETVPSSQVANGLSPAWRDVEQQRLYINRCASHGDFHGGNVLAATGGKAVLIDFGRTGWAPAALDPLTLELSLALHPDSPLAGSGWPSPAQAALWMNLDDYVDACPAASTVRACRQWAYDVGAGDREVAAVVYSYAVRQLKYGHTDEVATAMANAALAELVPS
jgi:CheY-like chemotaxis protein